MAGTHPSRPLRILALIEALSVTGPAKNLLGFGECVRAMRPCLAELTIATFRRGATPGADRFLEAAYAARIPVDVIPERAPFDTQHLPRLRAIVRERAPDLIQTHNTKSHFLVRLSGLWRERPWVAFHHGYTTTDFKMREAQAYPTLYQESSARKTKDKAINILQGRTVGGSTTMSSKAQYLPLKSNRSFDTQDLVMMSIASSNRAWPSSIGMRNEANSLWR